jgi:hypothetical protein
MFCGLSSIRLSRAIRGFRLRRRLDPALHLLDQIKKIEHSVVAELMCQDGAQCEHQILSALVESAGTVLVVERAQGEDHVAIHIARQVIDTVPARQGEYLGSHGPQAQQTLRSLSLAMGVKWPSVDNSRDWQCKGSANQHDGGGD